MADGIGDRLARGEKSASFPAGGGNVSQQRWDEIFGNWEPDEPVGQTSEEIKAERESHFARREQNIR